MRPREREQDQLPSGSSPTLSSPPPRPSGNLSSMVVRPSDSAAVGAELNLRKRGDSPLPFRRRGQSPTSYRPWPQRFNNNQGYLPRAGSMSPPPRHPRLDNGSNYDDDFELLDGTHLGRGFRGGRGCGRFRDVSPRNGFGRGSGGRSRGRGYDVDRQGISPFEGEYVHRNDPNLSPREGDWICGNPRCGNLNFARRTNCNNCDQPRYAPGHIGPPPIRISPPRRGGYYTSLQRRSPPPIDHHDGIRRNFSNRYGNRSPPLPRGWGAPEDPRHYVGITTGSPLPRRAEGRFQDRMPKDYNDDYNRRGGHNWHSDEDEFIPQRRYDRRAPSPSPRGRLARERSRSPPPPPVGRSILPLKGSSFMGRGGSGGRVDYRRYNDDFYLGRGHMNDSDIMGHGSGERDFRRSNDSFVGHGGRRGGVPRGMARGRNHADFYRS